MIRIIILIILLCVSLINAQEITVDQVGPNSTKGMINLLNMNYDESPIRDTSGNNIWAILKGANEPNFTTDGKFGGCYDYDGLEITGDYSYLPASADWDFGTGEFTVSFWMKMEDVIGSVDLPFVKGKEANKQSMMLGFLGVAAPGVPKFWWCEDGSNWDLNAIGDGSALDEDVWHYLVLTRRSNVVYLYVGGVEWDTWDVSGFPDLFHNASDSIMVNGALISTIGGSRHFYGGKIDGFFILSRGLTEAEVKDIYTGVTE